MNEYWKKWLGWSASREYLWRGCQRKYFYSYIGKWEHGLEGRRCKMLSRLGTVKMKVGKFIHDAIKNQLHHHSLGRPMNRDVTRNLFTRKMDELKSDRTGLIEYHNQLEIDDKDIEVAKEEGLEQLDNFFDIVWPMYEPLKYIQHEEIESFELEKYKIWAVIDFLSWEDNTYIITDWKTGKPYEIGSRSQMNVYILWCHLKYEVPFEDIHAEVIYFIDPHNPQKIQRREDDIEEFRHDMLEQIHVWEGIESKDMCRPDPGYSKCRYCNFLTICQPGKDAVEEGNIEE